MASSVHVRSKLPDYYELLGVPADAPFREIEAAYWRAATSERGRRRIPLLNEAYEVLGHKDKREAYDARRRAATTATKPEAKRIVPGTPGLRQRLYGLVE